MILLISMLLGLLVVCLAPRISYNDIDSKEILLVNGTDGNPITIPNAGSVSQAIDLRGFVIKAILMPAAWTAAGLSLKGSQDGVNFFPWGQNANGAETTLLSAIVGGNYVSLVSPGNNYAQVLPRFIKLVSGTNAAPVAQGANRVFVLTLVPFGLGA